MRGSALDAAQQDDRPQDKHRGRRRSVGPRAPLLAVAAVIVVVAGATAIVRTANPHQAQPVTHGSLPPPTSSAKTAASPQPGPHVFEAELFAGGHGFLRTQDSFWWTDNLGAQWRNITPDGLTATQLQSATVAVLPDGHQWVTLAPAAGSTSVSLLRRSASSQPWIRSSVPLGALTIPQYVGAGTSLSFIDPDHGWLMIAESVTHETSGELLHTSDGGATWTVQASRYALPVVGAIHFLTPTIGYLDANSSMGARGWWATNDGGKSWTQLRLPVPVTRKTDSLNILSAPTLAGDAIVLAASFTTPVQGTDQGVGIYRSTDGGATWNLHLVASEAATEQYSFAATADGSAEVLLRSQASRDLQTFTWVTSRSGNGGQGFTDATSVQGYSPGALTLADPRHLWTVGGAGGCNGVKTDCWTSAALIASSDGGATWRQVKLPS